MSHVPSLVVLLGLTLSILPFHKTMAQQFSESGVVYEAARNKIGLIRYCGRNELLEPAIADEVVAAVEAGLPKYPPDPFARERGDRAQQAGEDGFWETGRRRDIASVARLFRTTPADLCQEWADETLRAQRRRREVTTAIAPIQLLPQVESRAAESMQVPPAHATTTVVRVARSAPPPPLPEKAPSLPTEAEFVSLERTLPTGGHLAPTGRGGTGHISGTTAMPQSSGQPMPPPARQPTEAAGPPPREQTIKAAASRPRHSQQPHTLRGNRLFLWNRLFDRRRRSERCLMPGCRWPTAQERDSWRY